MKISFVLFLLAHTLMPLKAEARSCLSLMSYLSPWLKNETQDLNQILLAPANHLPTQFRFQDSLNLIDELLRSNPQFRNIFHERVESFYEEPIKIINHRSIREKFGNTFKLGSWYLYWSDKKPEAPTELAQRLLDSINIVYQRQVETFHLYSSMKKLPHSELNRIIETAQEMLIIQNLVLKVSGLPLPQSKISIKKKIWRLLRVPFSLLTDRQRARFSELSLTGALQRLIDDGKLHEASLVIRKSFDRITYTRWISATAQTLMVTNLIATVLVLSPSAIAAYVQSDGPSKATLPAHTSAELRDAEDFFDRSLQYRIQTLDRHVTEDLQTTKDPDEKEFLENIHQTLKDASIAEKNF